MEVELDGEIEFNERPECQGGRWLLGKEWMRINKILSDEEVTNRVSIEYPCSEKSN